MDTKKVARYIDLHAQKTAAEARVKALNKEIEALNDELVQDYSNEGIQNMVVNCRTAYLNRSIYSSLTGGESSLRVLADLPDWGWLVKETVNASQLSGAVRELSRDDNDLPILPENLKEHITVREVFQIRVRKS